MYLLLHQDYRQEYLKFEISLSMKSKALTESVQ